MCVSVWACRFRWNAVTLRCNLYLRSFFYLEKLRLRKTWIPMPRINSGWHFAYSSPFLIQTTNILQKKMVIKKNTALSTSSPMLNPFSSTLSVDFKILLNAHISTKHIMYFLLTVIFSDFFLTFYWFMKFLKFNSSAFLNLQFKDKGFYSYCFDGDL